ncbi:unnamed protein product, partial [Medioppia subpectinata]
MTSTTETATAGTDQTVNNTTGTQEPVSPVSENETTEQQTEASNTESASPKKAALPKPTVHKVDYEKDTVYLYQFPRCPAIVSTSPFCLKVETWLKMNDISYENVDFKTSVKSKKGQLPFVELNGKEIADSDIIIRDLSKHFDKDLDSGLTAEQKTVSHAFVSMLNNHTSWVVRWWRYSNPQKYIESAKMDLKRAVNTKLPAPVVGFLFKLEFKQNVKHVVGHGLGHHSEEEIYEFGRSDLKSLSD